VKDVTGALVQSSAAFVIAVENTDVDTLGGL
jgi:hypothetical protein